MNDLDPDLRGLPVPPLDPAFASRVGLRARAALGEGAIEEPRPRPRALGLALAAALLGAGLVDVAATVGTMLRIYVG